ncbi:MAG: hypothetical protein KIS29_10470 [Thermoplasmata archaeon]|nr:hypothetical protein [Candidatus Sysuiplasma jiujiangense]
MLPYEHIGFHFNCEDKYGMKGLFRGVERMDRETEEKRVECVLVVPFLDPLFYFHAKEEGKAPHMAFAFNGEKFRIPVGRLPLILKEAGYPLAPSQISELTSSMTMHMDALAKLSDNMRTQICDSHSIRRESLEVPTLYDYLGYDVNGKVKVIRHSQTVQFKDEGLEINDNVDEVRKALLELIEVSSDPKSLLITLAYAVVAPLAGAIKKRGKFFPNLALVGSPEAGKSSLINLFCARGWGTDENIRTSQDFVTQFASLKNLEGNGLPLIINDLKQEAFDRMRDLILSSVDGVRGGSRGTQKLELARMEISRSFVISTNWLQLGTQEIADRFITQEVHGKRGNEARWNYLADRLKGITYHIACDFFSDESQEAFDEIMESFMGSRDEVKRNIISLGMSAVKIFLSPLYELPHSVVELELEEYRQEDYFSMLLSWAEMEYDAMEKKYGKYESSPGERGVFVYREQNYVKKSFKGDGTPEYVIFPLAFQKFLRDMGPTFPFKSLSAFSDRYPERAKVDSRKYRNDSGTRDSFRVLIISGIDISEPDEPENEHEFRDMQIEIEKLLEPANADEAKKNIEAMWK